MYVFLVDLVTCMSSLYSAIYRDGTEYRGLKDFAPWGPPWNKDKAMDGYKTAYDHVSYN